MWVFPHTFCYNLKELPRYPPRVRSTQVTFTFESIACVLKNQEWYQEYETLAAF